jgi:hypothetical protein
MTTTATITTPMMGAIVKNVAAWLLIWFDALIDWFVIFALKLVSPVAGAVCAVLAAML